MTEDKFIKARELMDAIGFLERKLKELKNHNIVDVKSLLPQEWESFIGTALAIDTWLVLKDNFVKKADYTSVFDQLIIDIKEKIKLLKLEFKKL